MKVKLIEFNDAVGLACLTIGNIYEVMGQYKGTVAIKDDIGEDSELYEGEYAEVIDAE